MLPDKIGLQIIKGFLLRWFSFLWTAVLCLGLFFFVQHVKKEQSETQELKAWIILDLVLEENMSGHGGC